MENDLMRNWSIEDIQENIMAVRKSIVRVKDDIRESKKLCESAKRHYIDCWGRSGPLGDFDSNEKLDCSSKHYRTNSEAKSDTFTEIVKRHAFFSDVNTLEKDIILYKSLNREYERITTATGQYLNALSLKS